MTICGSSACSIAASETLASASSSSSSSRLSPSVVASSSSPVLGLGLLRLRLVIGAVGRRTVAFAAGAAVCSVAAPLPASVGAVGIVRVVRTVGVVRGIRAAAIRAFKVDDVAQQEPVLRCSMPRARRRSASACVSGDFHRYRAIMLLAAGLDTFGDGDLALARQQLDASPSRADTCARGRRYSPSRALRSMVAVVAGVGGLGRLAAALSSVAASSLSSLSTTLMPISDKHRHGVLDLLGRDAIGRQDLVKLVIGDVAALLGALDHLLDRSAGQVHQRAVLVLFARFAFGAARLFALRRHEGPNLSLARRRG